VHWALVEAAVHASRQGAPDVVVYRMTRARRDATVARLTVARKIGKRVYHTLRELERLPDRSALTRSRLHLSPALAGS